MLDDFRRDSVSEFVTANECSIDRRYRFWRGNQSPKKHPCSRLGRNFYREYKSSNRYKKLGPGTK